MKIGLFDSGIGGLTILKELLGEELASTFLYYADTNNSPYGEKKVEDIARLSLENINFLLEKGADIVVIACNTAVVALHKCYPETFHDKRIIDIITTTTDALLANKEIKELGILGTRLTIGSHLHKELLEAGSRKVEVFEQAAPKLCSLIEAGWNKEATPTLKEYLDFAISKELEYLLLACTHYPLLATEIKGLYSGKLIDPAIFIAYKIGSDQGGVKYPKPQVTFYINGSIKDFKDHLLNFLPRLLASDFIKLSNE